MQPEETSPSFDDDLPDNYKTDTAPFRNNSQTRMYEYHCHFCGVKVTTNYTLLLPLKCLDHGVLLQMREISV
jgi:hypothetical protein